MFKCLYPHTDKGTWAFHKLSTCSTTAELLLVTIFPGWHFLVRYKHPVPISVAQCAVFIAHLHTRPHPIGTHS